MRGGWVLWLIALVVVSTATDASAGATAYSGPLPRFASEPAEHPSAATSDARSLAPQRPSLDLMAALKFGGASSGCVVAGPDNLLQVAATR